MKNHVFSFYMVGLFVLFSSITIVLVPPSVLGAEEEMYYEPNTTMDIILKCFDTDSELCTTSTNCYLDIFYPNMTIFVYNATMTANGTFFNYTAPRTQTLGVFHASVVCSDGTTSGYTTFDFYVGRPSTEAQAGATAVGIYVLLGISALFFMGFIFVRKPPYKWSFFLVAVLFLVITINIASIALRNEAGSENIRNIFDKIGAVCYYMYWFIGGLFFIMWVFAVLASIGNKQNMRRAKQIGQPLDLNKQY